MPFVQTPNLNIHYELAGANDTILVLIHGYFASWRWWQPVLNQLPADYCAYAPDLRGCGDTERPPDGYTIQQLVSDLHDFATALNLPPFHLVGHSLGGVVALQFAMDHLECLRTLTLIAPAPAEGMAVFSKGKPSLPPPMHLFEFRREASLDMLDATYRFLRSLEANRPLLRRALKRMLPGLIDDPLFAALVDDAARMAPEAVIGYMQSVAAWNVQAELDKVQTPAIILWGDRDTMIPEAAPLKRTARGLRGRLVIWKNVGHAPQLEQPKRFIRFLKRFIERNPAVPTAGEQNWLGSLRDRMNNILSDLSGRRPGSANR